MISIFLIWIAGKPSITCEQESRSSNLLLLDALNRTLMSPSSGVFLSCSCNQGFTADAKSLNHVRNRCDFPTFSSTAAAAAAATTIATVAVFPARSLGDGPSVPGWSCSALSLSCPPAGCLLSQPRTRKIEPPVCSPFRSRRCNQASAAINHRMWTLRRAACDGFTHVRWAGKHRRAVGGGSSWRQN